HMIFRARVRPQPCLSQSPKAHKRAVVMTHDTSRLSTTTVQISVARLERESRICVPVGVYFPPRPSVARRRQGGHHPVADPLRQGLQVVGANGPAVRVCRRRLPVPGEGAWPGDEVTIVVVEAAVPAQGAAGVAEAHVVVAQALLDGEQFARLLLVE